MQKTETEAENVADLRLRDSQMRLSALLLPRWNQSLMPRDSSSSLTDWLPRQGSGGFPWLRYAETVI